MGFFKNPLKAHKKLNKIGVSATKTVATAGTPKQSPARGLLGGGGGGGNTGVVPPGMRTQGAPSGAPRKGLRLNERPYLAEGGKVGVGVAVKTKVPTKGMKRK